MNKKNENALSMTWENVVGGAFSIRKIFRSNTKNLDKESRITVICVYTRNGVFYDYDKET